jgi:aminopeptidase N
MMRDVLGEDGFKASIKYYTNHYAFSEVETSEFVNSVHEATGQSIEWFFDEWIYRGGEPFYEVNWRQDNSPEGNDQVVIQVRQAHQRNELIGLFRMPIVFEVFYEDGSSDRKTQWIEEEFSEVVISNPAAKTISFVLFDPGRKVLKTVSFSKSFNEWAAQAINAPGMIDRYDALIALRDYPLGQKETILLEAWNKETFHLTRTEIIKQLFAEESKSYDEILLHALQDADPLVRRAALENIKQVPESLKPDVEKLLTDQSYINVEKALDLLSRSFPGDIPQYLEMTKNETGWRGKNIRMKWLEIAISNGQREYLRELADYAGPHYEFETRMNAFQLLKRLNYLDKTAASNLISGYLYWNYKVSNAAKEVLVYFYQQNRYKEVIDIAVEENDFLINDKDRVKKMLQGSSL